MNVDWNLLRLLVSREAGKPKEVGENSYTSQSVFETIEIIEALIVALVAVATAWSGYQAAQWAGKRAEDYAKASRLRVTAEGLATLAGQERIYDSETFNSWLAAKLDGKDKVAEFFERRFRDEYWPAFAAWMKTEPFQNAQAPAGPIFTPTSLVVSPQQPYVVLRPARVRPKYNCSARRGRARIDVRWH